VLPGLAFNKPIKSVTFAAEMVFFVRSTSGRPADTEQRCSKVRQQRVTISTIQEGIATVDDFEAHGGAVQRI
jgi:hypothetical protein